MADQPAPAPKAPKRKGMKPKELTPVQPPEKEFTITDSLNLQVQMPGGGHAQVGRGGLKMPAGEGQGEAQGEGGEKKSSKPAVEALMQGNRQTYKFEDLKMGVVIGEGSQAKVRKVKHMPTKKLLALKIISFGPGMTRKVLQTELSRCDDVNNHPNLVTSLEAYFKEGFLMVLMEFMAHGTLQSVTKRVFAAGDRIPENVLAAIAEQILAGLNHLHTGGGTGNGLIHRDLKPSNMLVNAEGHVKISDFGVATFLGTQQKMAFTAVGSTAYMSPERVRGDGYTTASDIWAVGVSLAEIACGYFPIPSPALFELCCIIADNKAKVKWPDAHDFSPEFVDFVETSMKQDPAERPSAIELMSHPFIKKYENDKPDLAAWLKMYEEKKEDKKKKTDDADGGEKDEKKDE